MNNQRQQNYAPRPERPRWDKGFEFFKGDELNTNWVGEYARMFSFFAAENGLTSSQLRAFYNEFLRIRDITADQTEKNILIKLLEAKISYRHTARKNEMPEDMVNFISNLVYQIGDSVLKFKQACYIMEAVVGFFPKK